MGTEGGKEAGRSEGKGNQGQGGGEGSETPHKPQPERFCPYSPNLCPLPSCPLLAPCPATVRSQTSHRTPSHTHSLPLQPAGCMPWHRRLERHCSRRHRPCALSPHTPHPSHPPPPHCFPPAGCPPRHCGLAHLLTLLSSPLPLTHLCLPSNLQGARPGTAAWNATALVATALVHQPNKLWSTIHSMIHNVR